jgi:hypothetical protein
MARAGDGKMRTDYGPTSVITDPASGKMMLLDHVKKEVRTLPIPTEPPSPPEPPKFTPPGAPAPPPLPPVAGMTVKDLGKRVVDGHEVEGKQFTLPSKPELPKPPEMPKPRRFQKRRACRSRRLSRKRRSPPVPPLVTEVWTSTEFAGAGVDSDHRGFWEADLPLQEPGGGRAGCFFVQGSGGL